MPYGRKTLTTAVAMVVRMRRIQPMEDIVKTLLKLAVEVIPVMEIQAVAALAEEVSLAGVRVPQSVKQLSFAMRRIFTE